MYVYLPIAEISVNLLVLLAMGGAVGFLSGMLGVGGGFLMTPLLLFSGVPAPVAVGTEANQIVASSVSGALAQWRRGNVDIKLGTVLMTGGLVGSFFGVQAVAGLRRLGQVELFISLSYVVFLGIIGTLMLFESLRALRHPAMPQQQAGRRPSRSSWIDALPLKQRFNRSQLYVSIIPPLAIGVFVGFLAAVMGVGGGFIMVPAMIYLLKVPTAVVVGTSLFQIVFVTAFTTILHATQNQTVDIVLAFILMIGGVIGAQLGVSAGVRLKAEQLRALLAVLVLGVAGRLLIQIAIEPDEHFSMGPVFEGNR